MTKVRLLVFLTTLIVVAVLGSLTALYARGYRFNKSTLRFEPNGILVANSNPNGAQILINGELSGATNTTISLAPGNYDIAIKKEGYHPWSKRLIIEKEVVTEVEVNLFSLAPSLSAITFSGVISPAPSPDLSKIGYLVPFTKENSGKEGLWVIDVVNLPIGFNREPRQVTNGDLKDASWEWSPDSREILLTTQAGIFLLDINTYTPQNQRVNVTSRKEEILTDWQKKAEKKLAAKLAKLPDELEEILIHQATGIQFSPDETKILYQASGSAEIKKELKSPLPGSSTQKEERSIQVGKKYVYDIQEDRNFVIADANQEVYWFPTSNHLILPKENQILIVDYDGTNQQEVYSGSYLSPHAYPYSNTAELIILTNLGSNGSTPNLYSLSLK